MVCSFSVRAGNMLGCVGEVEMTQLGHLCMRGDYVTVP